MLDVAAATALTPMTKMAAASACHDFPTAPAEALQELKISSHSSGRRTDSGTRDDGGPKGVPSE